MSLKGITAPVGQLVWQGLQGMRWGHSMMTRPFFLLSQSSCGGFTAPGRSSVRTPLLKSRCLSVMSLHLPAVHGAAGDALADLFAHFTAPEVVETPAIFHQAFLVFRRAPVPEGLRHVDS